MAIQTTALKREETTKDGEGRRQKLPAPVPLRRMTVLDVASIEGHSMSGLYVRDKAGVRALGPNENPWDKKLLVRTNGLSREQADDLKSQGVDIVYLREVPSPVGMTLGESSEAIYRGSGREIWDTKVVPYASVNGDAEVRTIANRMSMLMMAGCG